jgi:hypothetical protein
MRIPKADDLPDAAQRSEWSGVLQCDQATLYRAEKAGLIQATKSKSGAIWYTKEAILEWLGLELVELEIPQGLQVKNTPRVKRQLVAK